MADSKLRGSVLTCRAASFQEPSRGRKVPSPLIESHVCIRGVRSCVLGRTGCRSTPGQSVRFPEPEHLARAVVPSRITPCWRPTTCIGRPSMYGSLSAPPALERVEQLRQAAAEWNAQGQLFAAGMAFS